MESYNVKIVKVEFQVLSQSDFHLACVPLRVLSKWRHFVHVSLESL